jgi:hypothetical protein
MDKEKRRSSREDPPPLRADFTYLSGRRTTPRAAPEFDAIKRAFAEDYVSQSIVLPGADSFIVENLHNDPTKFSEECIRVLQRAIDS